jgi:hypothetical protein
MLSNNKRAVQMLWLAAGVLFTFALVHSMSGGSASPPQWVSSGVERILSGKGGYDAGGRIGIREHMEMAEAAWQRSVDARHAMIRKDWGDTASLPLFAATDGASYARTPYSIWDFTPASYSCPHEMERIGRLGDGGKWVCGMSKYENFPKSRECIIYSFGVRDESSFENDMLSRTNCSVWAYDFSVVDFGQQLQPENRARAKFLQAGIAGKTDMAKDPPFYSISDLMKQNGHTYIDILKMDIEWWEFESMDGFMSDFPAAAGDELPLGQLMVEVHFYNGYTPAQYLAWWERMEARGLRPTWTEPNLLAVTLGGPPLLAEYTLLNVHDKQNVVFNRH